VIILLDSYRNWFDFPDNHTTKNYS